MNKTLFFERIKDSAESLACLLELSLQDVLDLIDDSGFFGSDLQKIKDAYGLTYEELCKIFLGVD